MTCTTPSMVTLVSAIFVATITFRLPGEVQEHPRLVLVGKARVQGEEHELIPGVQLREDLHAVLDGQLTLEEDEDVALCPFAMTPATMSRIDARRLSWSPSISGGA